MLVSNSLEAGLIEPVAETEHLIGTRDRLREPLGDLGSQILTNCDQRVSER